MAIGDLPIENYVPVVMQNDGLYTEKDIETTGSIVANGSTGVQLSSNNTVLLSGPVGGAISGTPGTLTATHKIAVNIEGVGTRYIHVGTVA